MKALKRPKLSATAKIKRLRALVRDIQREKLHEPDSDAREYCQGCHRSPYNEPPHDDGCLVPRIARVLRDTE